MREFIKKIDLRNLFFCCLLMLLLCGCENDLNDMEKELKVAKKKGYSIEVSTKYDAEDNVIYSLMKIYSGEQEIKNIDFNRAGNKSGYTLIEYYDDGRRYEEKDYNLNDEVIKNVIYEYGSWGNITAKRIYNEGVEDKVYRYRYDERNRLSSMVEDVADGTTQMYYYTTHYLYDEEGRLMGEEEYASGIGLNSFVVYVYDGSLLLKKEEYGVADEEYLEYYASEGLECVYDQEKDVYVFEWNRTEYEYDEEERLVKSVYYDEVDDYFSYITYEYH